jgi:adenosylcobinamide-GDP ribazoletransferase
MARVARVVPLVGLIVGVIAALVAVMGYVAGLPPLASALLAIGASAVVTGALHEDGLADVADGFGGGWTAERKLEIMKDSRIGGYGAVALVVVIGLEAVLVEDILARFGPIAVFAALVASATLSRVAALLPMTLLPPARSEGLGATAGRLGFPDLAVGGVVACLISSVGLFAMFGTLGAPFVLAACVIAAALAGLSCARLAKAQIGGHTGDVAGATQKLATIAVLAAIVIALPRGTGWPTL